jgi:hypothetical protein
MSFGEAEAICFWGRTVAVFGDTGRSTHGRSVFRATV